MRVCKKMVIYLGIKTPQSRKERKYTWQKNARISCSRNDCKYTWEKTARISCHNLPLASSFRINRLLISRFNLQASERRGRCKRLLVIKCKYKLVRGIILRSCNSPKLLTEERDRLIPRSVHCMHSSLVDMVCCRMFGSPEEKRASDLPLTFWVKRLVFTGRQNLE